MATEAEHRPGHIKQLDFDALAALPSSDSSTIPPGKQDGIATVASDATTATSDVATGVKGEVYRPAPPVRRRAKKHPPLPDGIQQSTLDELFAILSVGA